MPNTRSAARRQAKIEDVTDDDKKQPAKKATNPDRQSSKDKQNVSNTAIKRKEAPPQSTKSEAPQKKQKQKQQQLSADIDDLKEPIVINRAPVLQLWGAVVAQFLHPDLSWPACLSIGNAISALCAISKGKAIGMIEPKEDASTNSGDDQKKKKAKKSTEEVEVMGFSLHLDGDAVLMSGKPKPSNENTLKNKFGEEHYDATKEVMSEALQSWTDDKDELDKKAFHMYEKFRPNVSSGQRGWGRKGELKLDEIKTTIAR